MAAQDVAGKLQAAKHLVVVGGGPVGLELIGEVLDKYAGKSITLVHSGQQLLEGKAPKLQKHINHLLAKNKVTVSLTSEWRARDWCAAVAPFMLRSLRPDCHHVLVSLRCAAGGAGRQGRPRGGPDAHHQVGQEVSAVLCGRGTGWLRGAGGAASS